MTETEFSDGDAIRQLRALQAQRDAGTISQAQFKAAYRALDGQTGRACSICGYVPAVLVEAGTGRVLCGRCAVRD